MMDLLEFYLMWFAKPIYDNLPTISFIIFVVSVIYTELNRRKVFNWFGFDPKLVIGWVAMYLILILGSIMSVVVFPIMLPIAILLGGCRGIAICIRKVVEQRVVKENDY